jgi:ABC-type proline/glycine betaine transport system permease subunit
MLVLTSFFSVPAVLQGVNDNSLLIALNWAVVADMCAATSVGSIIWFFSLQQRNRFAAVWAGLTDAHRVDIENKVSP